MTRRRRIWDRGMSSWLVDPVERRPGAVDTPVQRNEGLSATLQRNPGVDSHN